MRDKGEKRALICCRSIPRNCRTMEVVNDGGHMPQVSRCCSCFHIKTNRSITKWTFNPKSWSCDLRTEAAEAQNGSLVWMLWAVVGSKWLTLICPLSIKRVLLHQIWCFKLHWRAQGRVNSTRMDGVCRADSDQWIPEGPGGWWSQKPLPASCGLMAICRDFMAADVEPMSGIKYRSGACQRMRGVVLGSR